MRQIPVISGRDAIKALSKLGYKFVRQRGSHVRLRHPERPPATIPAKGELSIKTVMSIIKQAELTVEEFLELLD
jgi:predicted RNA binding protein YcfA (HicA-like mRNA interferase family)